MRTLLNREYWSGPVGMARGLSVISATWAIAAALIGATGAKLLVPVALMMVGLAFIAGYDLGRKQR
jgi:hypothetical protein